MKEDKNILIAFILNLSFAIFEFIGGIVTNSVAIISDAIHDVGDSLSIGISYFLEKKSKQKPDDKYTYGYLRYSVLGSLLTTIILILGSVFVIVNAINRITNPVQINYNGMIVFAVVGVIVNFLAAYKTKNGTSLNQKAVNLHMLEDVLGWLVVLIGAIIMRITDFSIIDPILSILVAIFILVGALKNFKAILDLFLEKAPKEIKIPELKDHIIKINDVLDVHHIHVWSIDGVNNYATLHVVTTLKDTETLKKKIKDEFSEHNINHTTIEFESPSSKCCDKECDIKIKTNTHHHHH